MPQNRKWGGLDESRGGWKANKSVISRTFVLLTPRWQKVGGGANAPAICSSQVKLKVNYFCGDDDDDDSNQDDIENDEQ